MPDICLQFGLQGAVIFVMGVRGQHNIGLYGCTMIRIGLGDDRRARHGRMGKQAILYGCRSHAMAGNPEYIIAAAGMPVVAIRVEGCQVSGKVPVAAKSRLRILRPVPISQKE